MRNFALDFRTNSRDFGIIKKSRVPRLFGELLLVVADYADVKGFENGLIRMGIRGSEQNTRVLKLITRIFGGVLLAIGALLIMIIIRGIYLTGMSMSIP